MTSASGLTASGRKTLKCVATSPQCTVGENGSGYISLGSLPRMGAQFWFAIIGFLTSSSDHQTILKEHRSNVSEVLGLLIDNTQSSEVVRLALSFLNYATSDWSRLLLEGALQNPEEEVRLYGVRLITGLWLKIDDAFSFSKWGVPLLSPLLGDTQWEIADRALGGLLEFLPRCPIAGSLIRGMQPPFKLNDPLHRLLYGCCLASPGAWQVAGGKEAMAKELEAYVNNDMHLYYSQYCDEMIIEQFSSCFSRNRGAVEHYSNLKGNRKPRLPGRQSPPSIFSTMARNQLGMHMLKSKSFNFVCQCCETVVRYASADARLEVSRSYNTETVASIRSSICVLASIGSTTLGADWLMSLPPFEDFDLISVFHSLAKSSPVFSIRGTAIIALSVVANSVDAEYLVNCQWADRRRPSHLTRKASKTLSVTVTDVDSVDSPASVHTISIPDITIVSPNLSARSDSRSRRRASTNDIGRPPYNFDSATSSSSDDSSISDMAFPSTLQSLPVTPSLEHHRPSLPVIISRENSMTTPKQSKRKSVTSIGRRLTGLFRTKSNPRNAQSGFVKHNSVDAMPVKRRSMDVGQCSDSLPSPRAKSSSIDILADDTSPRSSISGLLFPPNRDSPGSFNIEAASLPTDDIIAELQYKQAQRETPIRHCQYAESEFKPKSLLQVIAEQEDMQTSVSAFYLPMEELSDSGRMLPGVFLPPNVSELLHDDVSNPPGFRTTNVVSTSLLARTLSFPSSFGNTLAVTAKAGGGELQQLFPPGQASNMINEHKCTSCLICCVRTDINTKVEVTDEWHQVLWLVVSLQIWPNRTPRMLQSYFANNRHLATNGCLYSEVVFLMSRLALPRLSRLFIHSLFDTLSFTQLINMARELTAFGS